MLKIQYIQKVIWYLESEIDLLKLTFIPISNNSKQSKSSIYFIPKPKEGLGIDGMGEFATAFESSGQFVNEKGQPVSYIQVAQILEIAFNFTFGNAYKSKERIFKRKPYNLTRAFDYLKNLIIKINQNKMKKDAFSKH